MSVIDEVRRDREELARVLKKHTGIRKIVEDFYPDSAHFIYELLQNAEDTGATEARFTLSKSSLAFEHNGRAFEPKDIAVITDIGVDAKANDEDKIGRFGVGFKAVFAYSETPHIWSPTYSFRITDFVLPSALDPKPDLGERTRFEFPFNNPKKNADIAYAEVEAGLSELAETTLLFLPHLQSVRWQIPHAGHGEILRVQHSENHFEVLKQSGRETTTTSHFLKFDQPVQGLEKKQQRVAVAFALDFLPNVNHFDPAGPLAKQLKIIAATPGRVAVSFPAEKETSGLRFHLHAPFVPEVSRASIKETPANLPLFQQLATLTAAALHQIRDKGLLTGEFLGVLPNPEDTLPDRYDGIRSAIVEEMKAQPLTPTHAKSHAPARQLLQGKASIKELLCEEDLEFLLRDDDEPRHWAIGAAQRNSNADRFLSGLGIPDWDVEEFVELLEAKAYVGLWERIDDDFMAWLSRKPIGWHQQLYALLFADYLSSGSAGQRENLAARLKRLRIVRVSDGTYSVGNECFFPQDDVEHDPILPRVDARVFTSGKSKTQQGNARKFLEEVDVREVGEKEEVEAILKRRYTQEAKNPAERTYRKDLKRFIALVEADPNSAELFADYSIFECADGQWARPRRVFLDQPFTDTGLTTYYEALETDTKRVALAGSYQDRGVSVAALTRFAVAVGVRTALKVVPRDCERNASWPELQMGDKVKPNNDSYGRINKDFDIPAFETLLRLRNKEAARLVWMTMKDVAKHEHLWAEWQRNNHSSTGQSPSQLVHRLLKNAWIPQTGGQFVPPHQADQLLLPEGFPFDAGWPWIKAIGFGQEVARKSDERRQKLAAAKQLGFSDDESLERAKQFASLPPQEQVRILADWERRATSELPDHHPANPARRAERIGNQAAVAPGRRTEERTRSVSIGLEAVKQGAEQYLRQQYTNTDGEMICQLCKCPLPFKLDDGTDYFEKVELVSDLKKRHYQNYLALCPNHAAMFQYANGSRDTMRHLFLEIEKNELDIILAQRDATIYFTSTHIADLKKVIEVDQVETEDPPADSDESRTVIPIEADN